MATGLPYDLTWAARSPRDHEPADRHRVQAQRRALPGIVGTYEGYARNADAHKRVMQARGGERQRPHRDGSDADVLARAQKAGGRPADRRTTVQRAAPVLAPTGTIGFMMDCDTTGIEPTSLVKSTVRRQEFMQIANQTIPRRCGGRLRRGDRRGDRGAHR
ncbi:MAG: hypothetical protein U0R65_02075 [Candidatus Nanopelagicales bacterium]